MASWQRWPRDHQQTEVAAAASLGLEECGRLLQLIESRSKPCNSHWAGRQWAGSENRSEVRQARIEPKIDAPRHQDTRVGSTWRLSAWRLLSPAPDTWCLRDRHTCRCVRDALPPTSIITDSKLRRAREWSKWEDAVECPAGFTHGRRVQKR